MDGCCFANFGYLTGYQLYSFVDAGAAWNDGFSYNDGLALTSAGAGMRFFLAGDLQADIGGGLPAELPRARQFEPQRTPAVLLVQRLQALSPENTDQLPLASQDSKLVP